MPRTTSNVIYLFNIKKERSVDKAYHIRGDKLERISNTRPWSPVNTEINVYSTHTKRSKHSQEKRPNKTSL